MNRWIIAAIIVLGLLLLIQGYTNYVSLVK